MRRKLLRALGILLGALLAVAGTAYAWYVHRPHPPHEFRQLYHGVTYERLAFTTPRPLVAHIVSIDLTAADPEFITTPAKPGQALPYAATPTSEFLENLDLQIAINADFFKPFWSKGPWNYYPKHGDPVYTRGLSIYDGEVITKGHHNRPSMFISEQGAISFENPLGKPRYAISGESIFLRHGRHSLGTPDKSYYRTSLQPRTAVGLSKDGGTFFLIVIDGRQPNWSEGCTVKEMADILIPLGVSVALDLDGGGSATLVTEGLGGAAEILNCPIDNWIPNRERPVANHLGLRIRSSRL